MRLSIYDRVRFIGQANIIDGVSPGDIGYLIEDYGDGYFEVEFSAPDGTTRALAVIGGHALEVAETAV